MVQADKDRPGDWLMDRLAQVPWWAAVGLALASFLVLNPVATAPLPPLRSPQDVDAQTWAVVRQGLAMAAQIMLPLLFLLLAVLSVLCRRHRHATPSAPPASPQLADGPDLQEFEQRITESFRLRGYTVHDLREGATTAPRAHASALVLLSRDGRTTLLHCRNWNAYRVGVATLHDLHGAVQAIGADGAVLVTIGRFTQEASTFAQAHQIELIDGLALLPWLRNTPAAAGPSPATVAATEHPRPPAASAAEVGVAPQAERAVGAALPALRPLRTTGRGTCHAVVRRRR
jgi:restriction system protein